MTIHVETPSIDIKERLLELSRPVGLSGSQVMAADSLKDLHTITGIGGRRNLLHNGGFTIWSAGESTTRTSNGYNYDYAPDQFTSYFAGTNTREVATLPTGERVSSWRLTLGAGSATRPNWTFIVEDMAKKVGRRPLTLSWWQRCSKNTNTACKPRLFSMQVGRFNGGAGTYSESCDTNRFVSGGTFWEHKRVTFHPTDNIYNHDHLLVESDPPSGDWGAGDWLELANMQLEVGPVATPFEYMSEAESQSIANRYYTKFSMGSYMRYALGYSDVNNRIYTTINLPSVMRTYNPVITQTNLTVQGQAVTSISTSATAGNHSNGLATVIFNVGGTPFTPGSMYQVYSSGALNTHNLTFDSRI